MDGGTGPGGAGTASGPGNAGTWHGPGDAVGPGSGHRRISPLMANGEFYTKPVLFGPMDASIGWSPPKFAPPAGTIFTTPHGVNGFVTDKLAYHNYGNRDNIV